MVFTLFINKNNAIALTRGDTAFLNFTVCTDDNSEYEMQEGDVLKLTVRREARADSPILLEASSDTATIYLAPEMTSQIDVGDYSYDVQLNTAAGDIFTIVGATATNLKLKNFTILPGVTV